MSQHQVLQSLKAATNLWHQRTEHLAYGTELRSGQFTSEMYADLIQKNHFIYHQLETRLENSTAFQISDFHQFFQTRRKDLYNDLLSINSSKRNFDVDTNISFATTANLVGVLYVLEGANLGRRLIHKMLAKQTSFDEVAHQPFYFYGRKDTPNRWQLFAKMAESYISTPQQQQMANETAIAVFQFFYEVYKKERVGI